MFLPISHHFFYCYYSSVQYGFEHGSFREKLSDNFLIFLVIIFELYMILEIYCKISEKCKFRISTLSQHFWLVLVRDIVSVSGLIQRYCSSISLIFSLYSAALFSFIVLNQFRGTFSLHRNQSTDYKCKSVEWFLYIP